MSVYADGVAAYRDSTKWLVAFVPITTVATGLVATGAPSFGRIRAQSETTLTHLVFAAILTTLALSAVMLSGTRVLDAEPESLSSLQKPRNRATLAKAISDGVIAPHFFDAEAFQKAMAQAQVDLSKAPPPAGLADQLSSLGAAVESLREWSVFTRTRKLYRRFLGVFGVGVLLVIASMAYALAQMDTSPPLTEPTPVSVTVNESATKTFTSKTGCIQAGQSNFVAVRGTWVHPVLAVTGAGCRFGAEWQPTPGEARVLPVPKS